MKDITMTLPLHATEASQKRYTLAKQLIEMCPPELGDEIALTGSTARGLADDDSDLELNLWSEILPPVEARVAWLKVAGVEAIEVFEQPRPDDSYWIGGRIGDVPLEVGWQTYAALEKIIEGLLDDQQPQFLADILVSAVPLRTQGRLSRWQERLSAYSDTVQQNRLQKAIVLWSKPNHLKDTYKLTRRGERLVVTEFLLKNLGVMMSLLYAVNRRWQPSSKWTLTVAHDLPLMPERWRERISAILTTPPEKSIRLCAELLLDALALVPLEYDVSMAVQAIKEGIYRGEDR
jgi:hypothetical protein